MEVVESTSASNALAVRAQRADLAARGLIHPQARLAAQRTRLVALAMRTRLSWARDDDARDTARRARAARLRRELRMPRRDVAIAAQLQQRLVRSHALMLARFESRLGALAQNLAHLSPQHVLERGYAIVTRSGGSGRDGGIVQDARTLTRGDDVDLQFAQGHASATVKSIDR